MDPREITGAIKMAIGRMSHAKKRNLLNWICSYKITQLTVGKFKKAI